MSGHISVVVNQLNESFTCTAAQIHDCRLCMLNHWYDHGHIVCTVPTQASGTSSLIFSVELPIPNSLLNCLCPILPLAVGVRPHSALCRCVLERKTQVQSCPPNQRESGSVWLGCVFLPHTCRLSLRKTLKIVLLQVKSTKGQQNRLLMECSQPLCGTHPKRMVAKPQILWFPHTLWTTIRWFIFLLCTI